MTKAFFKWLVVAVALSAAALAGVAHAAMPQAPPGMKAMTLDEIVAQWTSLTPRQQLAALHQIIELGDLDLAERLLDAGHFPDVYIADAEALRAAIRNRQGRAKEAAEVAERVLATFPSHRRARLELGQAKFMSEDDIAARENFELAVKGLNDPIAQNQIRQFIDAIDNRKRWWAQVTFGGMGSTNISQGTDTRIVYLNGLPFMLDGETLGTSGAAIWTGVSAGYVAAVASGLDLVTGLNANVRRVSIEKLNDSLVAMSLGPRWSLYAGPVPVQAGLYATGSYRWVADEAYAGEWGGRFAISARPAIADTVSVSVALANKAYSNSWRDDDLRYQNGLNLDVSATLDHKLSEVVLVRVLGGMERERTNTDHLDYNLWRAGAGVGFAVYEGLNLFAQGQYAELSFQGLSPGLDVSRHDQRVDATLQLTAPGYALAGFVPGLQYAYTRNASNVPFYDFDAHGVALTLTGDY